MADQSTYGTVKLSSGPEVWEWKDEAGSYLLFRQIARGQMDIAFRMGSDHRGGLLGFRVGEDGVPRLLESLAAWAAERSAALTDTAEAAVEHAQEIRARDEWIKKLEAAIEDALSSTWSKHHEDGWGTDEDGLYADSFAALAALVPHWKRWGDQAWEEAGRTLEELQETRERLDAIIQALEPVRAVLEGAKA